MVEHYDSWHIERDDGEVMQRFEDDEERARATWASDLYDRDEYRLVRNGEIVETGYVTRTPARGPGNPLAALSDPGAHAQGVAQDVDLTPSRPDLLEVKAAALRLIAVADEMWALGVREQNFDSESAAVYNDLKMVGRFAVATIKAEVPDGTD